MNVAILESQASRVDRIVEIIRKIDSSIRINDKYTDKNTIYIGSQEEVAQHVTSKSIYVTEGVLHEIQTLNLDIEEIVKAHPQLISLCMRDMIISTSGFDSSEFVKVITRITLLGGIYEKELTDDTVIVIAACGSTQKVWDAFEKKIPIVNVEWIDECYKNQVLQSFSRYRITGFYGCIMTSSDIPPIKKKELLPIIKSNGGVWTDVYDDSVSYLIANQLTCTNKIMLALDENVPIVKPDWIYQGLTKITPPHQYIMNWWCISKDKGDLFKDYSFDMVESIENYKILKSVIIANGGRINKSAKVLIAPHGYQAPEKIMVSPHWLLCCVSEKRILDPQESMSFTPFNFTCPLDGLQGKSISIMNFDDNQRLALAEIVRGFGATVLFSFSTKSFVVIAGRTTLKLQKQSEEYSIPILKVTFLLDIIKRGALPNTFDGYSLTWDDNEKSDSLKRKICDYTQYKADSIDSYTSYAHSFSQIDQTPSSPIEPQHAVIEYQMPKISIAADETTHDKFFSLIDTQSSSSMQDNSQNT